MEESLLSKYKFINLAILLMIAILYLFRINQDFWGDELYSLEHFVLVPLSQTASDFHVPNNHIFFSLLSNVYLKLIGVSKLGTMLDAPYIIRILPYLFCLALFGSVYHYGNKYFNSNFVFIALLLIASGIPYFNFALQIRGYGLSSLLLLLSVFESIAFHKNRKFKNLLAMAVFSSLGVYSILTNLTPVLLLYIFWFLYYLREGVTSNKKESWKSFKQFTVVGMANALLIFLLYLPVLNDLLSGEFIHISSPFLQWQIEFYLPHLKEAILSGRHLVFLLFLFCLLILYRKWKTNAIYFILFISITFLPVLVSYIRGDQAPLRTFVPLFGISALGLAIIIQSYFEMRRNQFSYLIFYILFFAYVSFSFYSEIISINRTIAEDIEEGRSRQYLYHQYYNSSYFPLDACKEFLEKKEEDLPLIILGCREDGIPQYLDQLNISYIPYSKSKQKFRSLKKKGRSFYIVSSHPNQIKVKKGDELTQLSAEKSFHTFLKYEAR